MRLNIKPGKETMNDREKVRLTTLSHGSG